MLTLPGFCCPFGLFRRVFFFGRGTGCWEEGGFRSKESCDKNLKTPKKRRAILVFIVLNSMQCLEEHSNSQQPNV